MKSAYELAMERLEKEQGPSRTLSDEQRAALAELDNRHEAKVAETRVAYESRMVAEPAQAAELRRELSETLRDLGERHERNKAAIWDAAG